MTRMWVPFLLTAVLLLLYACSVLPQTKPNTPSEITQSTLKAPSTRQEPTASPENAQPALKSVQTPTKSAPKSTITAQPSASSTLTVQPIDPKPSATIAPTASIVPTEIVSPAVTIMPTHSISQTEPSPPAATAVTVVDPATVNSIPVPEIAVLSPEVRENVRRIFLAGRQIGRDAHAFSKLGDSVTLTDHYLTRFDSGHYSLGPYEHLQPAIDFYAGSFARFGVATRVGLHAWSIFDPLWANKDWCLPNEHLAACEIRLHNPSVLLIKVGSNDSGPGSLFEENLRLLLDFSIDSGVIPILGTKADRFEGPDDRNNHIIRQLAQEYAIPLWDYDLIASTLPRRGLSGDDVHMTMADADDYTKSETFERGYPVSDLTALMTLNEVMREVTAPGDA